MSGSMTDPVRDLGRTLAGLEERVRAAVAGELGRAVGGAAEQVVRAIIAGTADRTRTSARPAGRPPPAGWDAEDDPWDRDPDPWADDPDGDGPTAPAAHPGAPPPPAGPSAPAVTTAVAAGASVARWWLVRRGTVTAAAGLGLGVVLLGLVGGPVVRAAVAALAAIAELAAVADGLADAAARLEDF